MKTADQLTIVLNEASLLLSEISEEEFSFKPSLNKWSKKEILGHLIDSAANNHQRFIRTQYEKLPSIQYDQVKWVELNNWQNESSNTIIELWVLNNRRIVEVIKNIPDERMSLLCNTGEDNFTLKYLVDDYVVHLKHHLNQIFS